MTSQTSDKKHLGPLLEFLRFVLDSDSSQTARFPKRINGVADIMRDTADSGVDSDSASLPHELRYEAADTSSDDQSPSLSRDDAPAPARDQERRKRSRSSDGDVAELAPGDSAPIDCELDAAAIGKGFVTSNYFDFSLLDLGVAPIVSPAATEMTKELAKQVKGKRCCYITPGTSAVVTGDVVDVDLSSDALHVSPDRGMSASLEWVHFKRVFQVPMNIAAVRDAAAARIQRIIEAARRGERTPRLSPVQVAVMPDEAPPPLPLPTPDESDQ